jgi:hypothetical protein
MESLGRRLPAVRSIAWLDLSDALPSTGPKFLNPVYQNHHAYRAEQHCESVSSGTTDLHLANSPAVPGKQCEEAKCSDEEP